MKKLHIKKRIISIVLITGLFLSPLNFRLIKKPSGEIDLPSSLKTPAALATYQFSPTNGTLVTGTEQTITSATAANSEGINVGSWKGTLGDDNFHWVIASTSSGYDVNLTVGGVQLNGANSMIIQTEIDLDATAPSTLFQVCDWSSSTGVNDPADAQCTTGGWRTLNLNRTAVSATSANGYSYQIYDGYWSNGSNVAISTPLTNFINGSNQVKVRYYSTTNTTSQVAIDYLRVLAVINPLYTAAGITNENITGISGDYTATIVANNQTGSDNNRNGAAGTAGSIASFYWTFKNVETYTGMNTILVRSEHSCDNTGPNYRPKIYNFATSLWEDLTTGNIACSTTDATNIWAINNITVADYIDEASDNQIRVGFYGLSNSTVTIRADFIYIMLGTTNTDVSACEISFGTNSAGDCANTRTIDTTAASSSTWNIATEDESTSFSHDFYPYDTDMDTTVEEAAASHVKFSVTQPANTVVTGEYFASRHMSGTGGTVTASLRDHSGLIGTSGGFTDIGNTGTTSLNYTDNVVLQSNGSNGLMGVSINPVSHYDSVNNQMWMRLRTSSAGSTANNSINQWDFAMVSLQWVEDNLHPTKSYQATPTTGTLITGSESTITSANSGSNEGINVGSWKATLADDNFHWIISSNASGYDANLTVGSVELNGANALLIETEFDLDSSTQSTLVQICDWVSATGVDAAADAECTGGGWRTLNPAKATTSPNTTVSGTQPQFHFQIYDGYWSNGSNSSISTPLGNFINGSKQVKVRYYSTVNITSPVSIDFLRVMAVINPVYSAAGFTNAGSGATLGDYANTIIGYFGSGSLSGADDARNGAAGTALSIADLYWTFKNVDTYTGMNSIVVRAEHSCDATGNTYRPKIYNFTSASWEDLTTGSIPCNTTDYANVWAKNNITVADYIDEANDNQIQVGFYGLANGTQTIRADYLYILLGTTNTDSSSCEISFGTGTATNCTKTRNLDATGVHDTWDITKETESTSFSHDYYPLDNNGDAIVEDASSANVKFSVTSNSGTGVTAIYHAIGLTNGVAYNWLGPGVTVPSFKDFSGFSTGGGGGFLQTSQTWNAGTFMMSYADNQSLGSLTYLGGASGMSYNPEDFLDNGSNQMWLRLRTSTGSTAGYTENVTQFDFALVSLQWIESASNSLPSTPSNLGPAGYVDAAGWMNDNTPTFTFDLSDPDVGQQVKYQIQIDDTAGFGSPVVDYTSALGAQGSFSFTVGQAAGGGSYTTGGEGIPLGDSAVDGGYYWRVKAIDAADAESTSYEEAGTDNVIDFRVDATAPTGGTVYDGAAGDQDWNNGSLTSLEANWTGFDSTTSGLQKYQYAVRRSSDNYYWQTSGSTWQSGEVWYDNGTNTSVTASLLNLTTGESYYYSVRAVDNAGNTGNAVSSNGQQVLPTLTFSLSTNSITFANLNNGNNWTDSQQLVTTTSTNAADGYTIKIYNSGPLTSAAYPAETIPDFSGTWASPAAWPLGTTGFGYTSSDTLVQGSNRFNNATQFAAFTQTSPGDIVADHPGPINGTTGDISNEQFTITYKVESPQDQSASVYQTTSVFVVTANY